MVLAAVAPYIIGGVISILYIYANITNTPSYSLSLGNINMFVMIVIGGTVQVSILFKRHSFAHAGCNLLEAVCAPS